jgi:pyruvate formate lyase activating enzyme
MPAQAPAPLHRFEASAGREARLRVGGLTALSTTDYPGYLAAVVFCQGCPWRCGYCHNPHLLPARGQAGMDWDAIVAFLERRLGLLDAVVFSGGEPLAQTSLPRAIAAVKSIGFRVALHTGGAYPQRLAGVLPLVDWVGFDVKTSFADYARITGVQGSGDKALASARLLLESGVEHEFRTTVHPRQHGSDAVARLAQRLSAMGVRRYVLQEFRANGCADDSLLADVPPSFMTQAWHEALASAFESFAVRRA